MISDELQKARDDWASDNLLGLWVILNHPDWLAGQPVLQEKDIRNAGRLALKLNSEMFEVRDLAERLFSALTWHVNRYGDHTQGVGHMALLSEAKKVLGRK